MIAAVKRWIKVTTVTPGLIVVLLAVTIFAVGFYYLQVRLYDGLHMTIRDLQMSNQSLYNTLNGRFMEINFAAPEMNLWVDAQPHSLFEHHMYLILFLILPLYALFPDVYILFLLQAVATAFGGLAIYLISRDVSDNDFIAACLGIAYLLYPTVQGMTLNVFRFGFHPDILFPTFLLFAFYSALRDKQGKVLLFSALALLCSEHLSITVAAFGIYLILFNKRHRALGFIITTAAMLWVALSVGVFIPYFRGAPPRYVSQAVNTAEGMELDVMPAILTGTLYTKYLFLPVAFTFLLHLPSLILALPGLLLNVGARYSGYGLGYNPFSWRMAQLSPFVFLSSALGISYLHQRLRHCGRWRHWALTLSALVMLGSLASGLLFGPLPWSRSTSNSQYTPLSSEEQDILSRIKEMIGPDASLSADPYWGSQFTARRIIRPFPIAEGWEKDDYVLAVLESAPYPRTAERLKQTQLLEGSCTHRLILREHDVVLYKRLENSESCGNHIGRSWSE